MDDALKLAEDKDKEKAKWIKNYFDKELFDPLQFHIVISLSLIPAEKALTLAVPSGTALFEGIARDVPNVWLKNRLLEKKAETVLFYLGASSMVQWSSFTPTMAD